MSVDRIIDRISTLTLTEARHLAGLLSFGVTRPTTPAFRDAHDAAQRAEAAVTAAFRRTDGTKGTAAAVGDAAFAAAAEHLIGQDGWEQSDHDTLAAAWKRVIGNPDS